MALTAKWLDYEMQPRPGGGAVLLSRHLTEDSQIRVGSITVAAGSSAALIAAVLAAAPPHERADLLAAAASLCAAASGRPVGQARPVERA